MQERIKSPHELNEMIHIFGQEFLSQFGVDLTQDPNRFLSLFNEYIKNKSGLDELASLYALTKDYMDNDIEIKADLGDQLNLGLGLEEPEQLSLFPQDAKPLQNTKPLQDMNSTPNIDSKVCPGNGQIRQMIHELMKDGKERGSAEIKADLISHHLLSEECINERTSDGKGVRFNIRLSVQIGELLKRGILTRVLVGSKSKYKLAE